MFLTVWSDCKQQTGTLDASRTKICLPPPFFFFIEVEDERIALFRVNLKPSKYAIKKNNVKELER